MYISTQNISQFRNHFTLPLKVTLPCESSYWIPLILRSWKLYQAHQTMRVMNWTLDFDIIVSLLLSNIIFIRNIFFVHVWVWLLDKEASWAVNEKLTFKTHMWNLDFRTLLLKTLGNKNKNIIDISVSSISLAILSNESRFDLKHIFWKKKRKYGL